MNLHLTHPFLPSSSSSTLLYLPFTSSFPNQQGDKFASLLGHFGQLTNVVSFVISLFGFSFLVHRLGVKFALLIFPSVLFVAVVVSDLHATNVP